MTPHQRRRLLGLCDGCNQPIPPESPYKCRCVPCQLKARKALRERYGIRSYEASGRGRPPLIPDEEA